MIDKRQITIFVVALAAVALSVLYYLGYIKLPAIVQPVKEKTQEELLSDFKIDLVAGKLTNINGTIVKIDGKVITLTTAANGEPKEQNIILADKVLIRRLTAPEIKPGDGPTPMIETFITPADLRIGDNVLANLNKDGMVVVLDIPPGFPGGVATTTGSQLAGATTTEQVLLERLLDLKQKAFTLRMAGKTIQIFGAITGIEKDALTVLFGAKTYHLQITADTVVTDIKEDPITKKPTDSFIALADLRVGDYAAISADGEAKIALLVMRQRAIK